MTGEEPEDGRTDDLCPAFGGNERMFSLDVDESEKEATFWWWWIFFLDPPVPGSDPAQLTVMCTSRNTPGVMVDSMRWKRKGEIHHKDGKGWYFPGMTLAWYYDGNRMHDTLVRRGDRYRVDPDRRRLKDGSGTLRVREDGEGMHLTLVTSAGKFRMKLSPVMDPDKGFLKEPVDDGNTFLGKYEYRITEIFRAEAEGSFTARKVVEKDTGLPPFHPSRKFRGTGYFQRVSLRAPAPPWYWAMVHFPDGSFLDYFQPRLSAAMLRTDPPGGQAKERLSVPLSHNIEFYNAREDTRHVFKNLQVKKWYERNRPSDLPMFRISGRASGRKGENLSRARISITLESLSRAEWKFAKMSTRDKKSHVVGVRKGPVLVYNEYPARVTTFEFVSGGTRVSLDDLGGTGRANCEDVWGMMW